jgi:hypothetical protein
MEPTLDAPLLRYFNPDFLNADLKVEAGSAELGDLDARLLSVCIGVQF